MNLALRIFADVICVALGCYISVLRDKNKRLEKRLQKTVFEED